MSEKTNEHENEIPVIKVLVKLIDGDLLDLPAGCEEKMVDEIKAFEAAYEKMPYVTSVEKVGIRRGQKHLLQTQLKHKFGELSKEQIDKIYEAPFELFEKMAIQVLMANTLDDFFVGCESTV